MGIWGDAAAPGAGDAAAPGAEAFVVHHTEPNE